MVPDIQKFQYLCKNSRSEEPPVQGVGGGGAMRIRGLSDEQIESYFSDMISKEELQPYLEGSELQGYRRGLRESKDKWLAEGKTDGKTEVAKTLLGIGMPVEQIASVTGLTAETVEGLR